MYRTTGELPGPRGQPEPLRRAPERLPGRRRRPLARDRGADRRAVVVLRACSVTRQWRAIPGSPTRRAAAPAHDAIDRELAAMVATADRDELAARTRRRRRAGGAGGEPACRRRQRAARGAVGFYEPVVHPVAGRCASPASRPGGTGGSSAVAPAPRAAAGPAQRRGAGGAGGRRRRSRALAADGVIGDRPVG